MVPPRSTDSKACAIAELAVVETIKGRITRVVRYQGKKREQSKRNDQDAQKISNEGQRFFFFIITHGVWTRVFWLLIVAWYLGKSYL